MGFVRQDLINKHRGKVRIDDISAVDRLFQGLLCSVWRVNFKLNRQKYLTTQIGNAEEIILRIVDIRSTFRSAVQATFVFKKMNPDKALQPPKDFLRAQKNQGRTLAACIHVTGFMPLGRRPLPGQRP